jgi:hypothetical protein
MKLQQGDRIVILYAASLPLIFHERYVVLSRGRWTVSLSRDGDAYAEDFGESSSDVLLVRKWDSVDSGMIPRDSIYRFPRAPGANRIQGLVAAATAEIDALESDHGIEDAEELVTRAEVAALVEKSAELDDRLLKVKLRAGERHRDWSELPALMQEVTYKDWPLEGPRVGTWCVSFLARTPGGIGDRHETWRRQANLRPADWGVSEHASLCEIVRLAGQYDQVHLTNLVSVEAAFRRLVTIEFVHMDRVRESLTAKGAGPGKNQKKQQGPGSRLSLEEEAVFTGLVRGDSLMLPPALMSFVKEKVKADAELAKALRQSRAERHGRAGNKDDSE